MTDAEIKQLAMDYADGKVFFDRNIQRGESENIMGMIFMPLMMLNDDQRAAMIADPPYAIYEYYSAAGPRSINGYPIFMSFRQIKKPDWDKFVVYLKEYEDMRAAFAAKKMKKKTTKKAKAAE